MSVPESMDSKRPPNTTNDRINYRFKTFIYLEEINVSLLPKITITKSYKIKHPP